MATQVAVYTVTVRPLDDFNAEVDIWVSTSRTSLNRIPFFTAKLSTHEKGGIDELIKYGVPEILSDLGLKMTNQLSPSIDPKRGLYLTTYAEKETA